MGKLEASWDGVQITRRLDELVFGLRGGGVVVTGGGGGGELSRLSTAHQTLTLPPQNSIADSHN